MDCLFWQNSFWWNNQKPCSFFLLFCQVLTRRDQLAAKKKGKNQETDEGNGDAEAHSDDDAGDEQDGKRVMKKPAAKTRAKAVAKRKAKVETQNTTDAEAQEKPAKKRRSSAKSKAKKAVDEQHESEQQEPELPEGDLNLDPKRKLFPDLDQGTPEANGEVAPTRKRLRKATPAADAAEPSGQSKQSPKAVAKSKAKAASRRPKRTNDEDKKGEDGQDAQPKRRAKKSRQQREAEEADLATRMNLEDDMMKAVVLQVLREVKTMTVDELKEHLSTKKESLPGKHAVLNVYWSRTNSRCRYLLDPATPDTANFYFNSGTWNTRMAAAFIGSWLMVTQRCFWTLLK